MLRIKYVLKGVSVTILNQHLCYLVLYNCHFCHINCAPTVCLMPRHVFILFKCTPQEKKIKKNIQGRVGRWEILMNRTIDSEDYSHKLHSAAGVITVEDIV